MSIRELGGSIMALIPDELFQILEDDAVKAMYSIWQEASHQSEWLQSKNLQAINAGEGVEKREPSYTVGGNAN